MRLSRLSLVPCLAVLLASVPSAAQTVATPHDAHRMHGNSAAYIAALEDPARDAWQKPHEVVVALDLKPGETVADIGAGSGYFALRFARHVGAEARPQHGAQLVLHVRRRARVVDDLVELRRNQVGALAAITPKPRAWSWSTSSLMGQSTTKPQRIASWQMPLRGR